MTQSWTSYSSKPDHFTAQFPAKVQTQSSQQMEAGHKIKTSLFIAQVPKGPACILSATVIPSTITSVERGKMNDGIVFGFLNSSKFSKVSEKQATFGANRGRYIKVKRGTAEGALWIIASKDTVFTLTLVNPKGDSTSLESKFFGSFKITR